MAQSFRRYYYLAAYQYAMKISAKGDAKMAEGNHAGHWISTVGLVVLACCIQASGLAYFKDYPPYRLKDGSPRHVEAETLVDPDKDEYKSADGSIVVRLRETGESVDFLVKDGKYTLARETTLEHGFPDAVYRADLRGNGLKDYIIFYDYAGCGLGSSRGRVEIFLKKETGGYRKISYDTFAPGLEDFVDLNKDGKYEVIITDYYFGERHTYYSYSIYEFKGYELVNADKKFKGFPKFVWYTYKANDKNTGHLAKPERLAHTKEKDAMIWYEDITKTEIPK